MKQLNKQKIKTYNNNNITKKGTLINQQMNINKKSKENDILYGFFLMSTNIAKEKKHTYLL